MIVTAIGDPLSFKKSVSFIKCKIVKQLNFKDHFNYSQGKWEKIEALCLKLNVEFILTTEKDWIKIENLKTKIPIIVLGLKVYFNKPEAFLQHFKEYKLIPYIWAIPQAKTTPTNVNINGHPVLTSCLELGSWKTWT